MYKGEYSSHPSNPQNGWYYRNITDKKSYVYQDDAWYVMTVDGSDGKNGLDGANGKDGADGLDIVWKGDSSIPPANPQKNWVYRDTDNGRVYIYNGLAWELMVADGNDGTDGTNGIDGTPGADGEPGKDGMRVYITYHDSEEEPEIPVGDGTTNGWHTDSTESVIWISQKVSESADSGEWGDPIRVKGEPGKDGQDANLLPWIEKWNGYATELGEEYIVTPKMFSGTKSADGKLTGIAQGKDCLTAADGTTRTGIFALVDNEIVFELDPLTKKYAFRGKVETQISGKRIVLDPENSSFEMYNINDVLVFSLSFEGNASSAYPKFLIQGTEFTEYYPYISMTGKSINAKMYCSEKGSSADVTWGISENGIYHKKNNQGFSLNVDLAQTNIPIVGGSQSLHLTRFAPGFLPGYSTAKTGEVYVTSDGTLKIKGYSVES